MNVKHPAMLAALLLISSVVLADNKNEKTEVAERQKGDQAGASEKDKWIHLLSADTKRMEVMHFDDKIVVMLNGVNVNAHDLGPGGELSRRPRTGWIGFQDHALPISLRNIRIRTPSAHTGSTVSGNR